jgi:hypothetical protein
MRVLKLPLEKLFVCKFSSSFKIFNVLCVDRLILTSKTRAVLPYADLAIAHPVRISIGLRLASLSLLYTHLCIFIDLSWHLVCFSRGFLQRFWHLLHISSHPMIFFVSSVILLSLCAFRILEYLLGYFLEILCMKILLCLCVGLIMIYLCVMSSCIAYISLWHPFDSHVKYHIMFGTNRI